MIGEQKRCALHSCDNQFISTGMNHKYCCKQHKVAAYNNSGGAKEYSRRLKKENHQHYYDYHREWVSKNKDKRAASARKYSLKKNFALFSDDYDKMLSAQNGVCAICLGNEVVDGRNLAVDHDEKTGFVRGLLCFRCNRAIGGLQHNIEILMNAVRYLQNAKEAQEEKAKLPVVQATQDRR